MAYQANDLFQLQTELVEAKVDIAVGKASDRIIDRISDRIENLTIEVHKLNNRLAAVETKLGNRLAAVEVKLGMRNETRDELRNRFIEYTFKAGWLILAAVVSGVFLYLHHT